MGPAPRALLIVTAGNSAKGEDGATFQAPGVLVNLHYAVLFRCEVLRPHGPRLGWPPCTSTPQQALRAPRKARLKGRWKTHCIPIEKSSAWL